MGDQGQLKTNPAEIRSALYQFLSYRPRTRSETVSKFRTIVGNVHDVDSYLEEFEELGLIDDRQFALDFIDVRLRSKNHGHIRIRRDLVRKGIATRWIEQGMASLVNSDLEIEAAQKSIAMRWQRKGNALTKKDFDKIRAALRRRGFDYETIKKALDGYEWS